MSNRELLKHSAEIEKATFRKLIGVDVPAFCVEHGNGWQLSLYRGDCGVLCASWHTSTGATQYYIIDINA